MITHVFIVIRNSAEFLRRLPGDMRSWIKIEDTLKGMDYIYNKPTEYKWKKFHPKSISLSQTYRQTNQPIQ